MNLRTGGVLAGDGLLLPIGLPEFNPGSDLFRNQQGSQFGPRAAVQDRAAASRFRNEHRYRYRRSRRPPEAQAIWPELGSKGETAC